MAKGSGSNDLGGLDILGIEHTIVALRIALRSDTPVHFMGPPGIGKSSVIDAAAEELKMPIEVLLLSQCDPTDVGGFPVVEAGALQRLPLGPVKAACEGPVILFLDELSCAPPAVQGAALQLIYARRAGDVKLHPGSRIVAASNPPDQAAGGWELALPVISRMTQIQMRPTKDEVQNWFYKFGPEGSMMRRVAVDWAATLESAPDLLQIDPPPGAQSTGKAWGNPRSWERAIRFVSVALEMGEKDSGPVFTAGLAGNVGEEQAAAYMSIRKIRDQLPSVTEIRNNPDKAKTPKEIAVGVACLGILAQVAVDDPCPAWVYAARIQSDELKVASMHVLGKFGIKDHKNSKWFKEADAAQSLLLRGVGNAMRST